MTLAALLAGPGACAVGGTEGGRTCTLDEECVSGVCRADGTCAAPGSADVDAGDAGDASAGAEAGADEGLGGDGSLDEVGDAAGDGGPSGQDSAPDGAGDGGGGACRPDRDGVVRRDELPLAAGYEADFRVTTGVRDFNTEPQCSGGACVWDLVEVAGVTEERGVDTLALAGRWFADEPAFARATYAAELGDFAITWFSYDICRQRQLGVFEVTADALRMLGVVSEREDGGTLLVYDPPLVVLQLPLALGTTWTAETTASGPLCNSLFDYAIAQTLTGEVDALGAVVTPYGTFTDVLRVNTLLERHLGVGVLPSSVRTHTFVAECFSTVATVRSAEGVEEPEFDEVAEVRRLVGFP
jgi:hypothetical protein